MTRTGLAVAVAGHCGAPPPPLGPPDVPPQSAVVPHVIVQRAFYGTAPPPPLPCEATQPPPVITGLGRPIVADGDTLVVLGQHFAGTPAQNFATINGQRATVIGAANERLILQVPQGATTGPVVVRVAGQTSNAVTVDVYARLGRTRLIDNLAV